MTSMMILIVEANVKSTGQFFCTSSQTFKPSATQQPQHYSFYIYLLYSLIITPSSSLSVCTVSNETKKVRNQLPVRNIQEQDQPGFRREVFETFYIELMLIFMVCKLLRAKARPTAAQWSLCN